MEKSARESEKMTYLGKPEKEIKILHFCFLFMTFASSWLSKTLDNFLYGPLGSFSYVVCFSTTGVFHFLF